MLDAVPLLRWEAAPEPGGPASVKVAKRQDTIVYAWGSAQQGNLAVAVQTVKTH